MVIMHLKHIGKVKKLDKWVPHELIKKKIIIFICCLLLFLQQQWTISWLDCDVRWKVDFIQWPATTNSVVEPRRSSKVLPKAKLAPKKGHCHCLVICWCSEPLQLFWILVKPLHLRSMLSKLMTCCKCLQPVLVNGRVQLSMTVPTACCTTRVSKVEWLGLWSFASYTTFTWPLANWPPLLQASWQLFLQGKHFHNQQEAENAFQEFVESRSLDF